MYFKLIQHFNYVIPFFQGIIKVNLYYFGLLKKLMFKFGPSKSVFHPTGSVNKQITAFSNQAKVKENYLEVIFGKVSINSSKKKVTECIIAI